MSRPMNKESAKKWWECGRHVRQKEPAPSAEVRRTTPEVDGCACAARHASYVAEVLREQERRGRARFYTQKKLNKKAH